jgi:hypothetical protein
LAAPATSEAAKPTATARRQRPGRTLWPSSAVAHLASLPSVHPHGPAVGGSGELGRASMGLPASVLFCNWGGRQRLQQERVLAAAAAAEAILKCKIMKQ